MAIRLKNKENTSAENSEYPYGNIRDDDGSGNGTPVNMIVHQDYVQFFHKMMDHVIERAQDGFDYNDIPDNEYDGWQFFEALLRVKPYKVYVATVSQNSTNAPVPTVLENTIGTIVWTRTNVGVYLATLNDAFTAGKTWLCASSVLDGTVVGFVFLGTGSVNQLVMRTTNSTNVLADSILNTNPAHIEIRVYP